MAIIVSVYSQCQRKGAAVNIEQVINIHALTQVLYVISLQILISHFPIKNRKASMDCLEGQSKVVENFKLKLEQEITKDASLPLRESLKSCLQYPFHVS